MLFRAHLAPVYVRYSAYLEYSFISCGWPQYLISVCVCVCVCVCVERDRQTDRQRADVVKASRGDGRVLKTWPSGVVGVRCGGGGNPALVNRVPASSGKGFSQRSKAFLTPSTLLTQV